MFLVFTNPLQIKLSKFYVAYKLALELINELSNCSE